MPLTTADVPSYAAYKQGSSISLRYWGHSAGGPTECILAAQRPLIVETGTLSIVNPPETRVDLTQDSGALALPFGPIVQSGVTFAPIGICARLRVVGRSGLAWRPAAQPVRALPI